MCGAGPCTVGQRCTGAGTCASGLECTGGTCQSTAPKCGDGVITRPQEQCEIGVDGYTQWNCGPDWGPEAKQCKYRTIYTVCSGSGSDCGADTSCQSLDGVKFQCMPSSGLGFNGVGKAEDVCPAVDGFTQGLFGNDNCVIDCTQATGCPSHLPSCALNPLAEAGPEEAPRFCVP